MSKKLLDKTLRTNLLFSGIVLLIAAPFFYFEILKLYLEETDETLLMKKNELLNSFKKQLTEKDVPLWNRINHHIIIHPRHSDLVGDTFFYATVFDSNFMDEEYCRVLWSSVRIGNHDYVLKANVSMVETEDLLKNIAWLFLGILLFLLTGFYVITRMLSKRLWRTFYDTLAKIEQFEIDKHLTPHFEATSVEEFRRLNQAITKLVEKNTAIYKSQREFVENAAHELQTPLAIFQAKIDTLIQRPDVTEGQAAILGPLNEAAGRLNKLNKNLLLLSKIESNQFPEVESISLNDVLARQLPFFKEQGESRNIAIHMREHLPVTVKFNQVLLEMLISNLFLNAIRHNVPGGFVDITVSEHSLIFSNTGAVHALDKAKLFQRFAKLNPSSSGNGLGLSIIKTITDINQWTVKYNFTNSLHHFEIIF